MPFIRPCFVVASVFLEAGSGIGLANLAVVSAGSAATTFTARNVPSGTYFVRVRGQNAVGVGGPSQEMSLVVPR